MLKVKEYCITIYNSHKLTIAGSSKTIIEDAVNSPAHSYSRGNPRLIDNVMTYALDLDAQLKKEVIDAETMMLTIEIQSLI